MTFHARTTLLCALGFALALTLCALVGCGRDADLCGEDRGPRLAVLSPALALGCADAGIDDLIVARHAADFVSDSEIPAAADMGTIDYEALIAACPTHVVIERSAAGTPARLEKLARSRGWELMELPALTLAEMAGSADALHRLARELGRTPSVAMPSGRLAAALEPVEGAHSIGPVLLLGQTAPASALGPGSFHDDMLKALGAARAIGDGHPMAGAWVRLSVEDLVALDPAGIIIFEPREGRVDVSGVELLGRVGEIGLRAVREGRVAVIDDPRGLLPSVSMIGVGERMTAVLRSWVDEEE